MTYLCTDLDIALRIGYFEGSGGCVGVAGAIE